MLDNYYHIPKKLGPEQHIEEWKYQNARMLFDMKQEQEEEEKLAAEERRSLPPRRAAVSASDTSDHIPGTANVA